MAYSNRRLHITNSQIHIKIRLRCTPFLGTILIRAPLFIETAAYQSVYLGYTGLQALFYSLRSLIPYIHLSFCNDSLQIAMYTFHFAMYPLKLRCTPLNLHCIPENCDENFSFCNLSLKIAMYIFHFAMYPLKLRCIP